MKTYLCIGAGPGIGAATAKRFLREGYRVVLVSRTAAASSELKALFEADAANVTYEAADASDPQQMAALIEKYEGDDLEVVHYNAAVMRYDTSGALIMQGIESETASDIANDIAVNVSSALATVAKVIPIMRARGTGTILLTGGGLAVQPSADLLTLSIGKAAMRTIGEALFEPLKRQGIHIASVRVSTLVASDPGHPRKIADAFWNLHDQATSAWTWETLYPNAA
jgi:short-subunit dehydrogenase